MASRIPVRFFAALFLGLIALSPSPRADDIGADAYKGKQVTLIISLPVGGGYDVYARTMARHMPKHLAGNPVVVPQNMPGAGGLRATSFLYEKAPKDGLTIGAIQNTVPFEPLFQPNIANFDVRKFNWLGSPNSEVGLFLVWGTSPVKTLDDAKRIEITVGATGAASTPAYYSRVLNAVFGTKQRIVSGYQGQPEAFLAMERGEIDGFGSAFWSSVKVTKPEWIADHKVNLIVQYALEPHPDLKDVPFALNLVTDPEKRAVLEVASAPLSVGRPFVAPPGVPLDRVATLRAALQATFKDPDFLGDAAKQNLEVTNTKTGDELAAIMERVYSAPPAVIQRLRAIYDIGMGEAAKEGKVP